MPFQPLAIAAMMKLGERGADSLNCTVYLSGVTISLTDLNKMLRGMLKHTQLILITHNRKTMEIANRLYGVTMEEPGVSKLISVQMN